MRYTEDEMNTEINNVGDLVRYVVVSVIQAPIRLLGEISSKVMYLRRDHIEKLLLVSILINVGLLVIDVIGFLVTDNLPLFDGYLPIIVKVIVLLICGGLSLYVNKNVSLADEMEEVVPTVVAPVAIEPEVVEESVQDMIKRMYNTDIPQEEEHEEVEVPQPEPEVQIASEVEEEDLVLDSGLNSEDIDLTVGSWEDDEIDLGAGPKIDDLDIDLNAPHKGVSEIDIDFLTNMLGGKGKLADELPKFIIDPDDK